MILQAGYPLTWSIKNQLLTNTLHCTREAPNDQVSIISSQYPQMAWRSGVRPIEWCRAGRWNTVFQPSSYSHPLFFFLIKVVWILTRGCCIFHIIVIQLCGLMRLSIRYQPHSAFTFHIRTYMKVNKHMASWNSHSKSQKVTMQNPYMSFDLAPLKTPL